MDKIKRIDIKEFRELGYLQELNRRFLHPLGLALEIIIDDNGEEKLGGIWDYRMDEVGIYYDIRNSDRDRRDRFIKNRDYVKNQFEIIKFKIIEKLGFGIEPID
jgi:hypothetical protein